MSNRIKCIEHVQVTVHELDVSIAFYETLGFAQQRTIHNESEGYTVIVLAAGIVVIELLQFDRAEPRNQPFPSITAGLQPLGYRHLAFRVESVREWRDWAVTENLKFFGERLTATGASQVFLRDPDGNLLEFTEIQA